MKNTIFTVLVSLFLFISCNHAQTINSFKARCAPPNQSSYASGTAQLDGNINLIPCPTKSVQINGSAIPTGTGTANRVPYWTGTSTLGSTPITWNGTSYTFQNTTGNALLPFIYTPTNSATVFQAGGFQPSYDYFTLSLSEATNINTFEATVSRSGGGGGNDNQSGITAYASNVDATLSSTNLFSFGKVGIFVNGSINFDSYTTANAFKFEFIPSTTAGRWRVGNYASTATRFLDLDYAGDTLAGKASRIDFAEPNVDNNNKLLITTGQIGIGDVDGNLNNTRFYLSDNTQTANLDVGLGSLAFTGTGTPLATFTTFDVRFGGQSGIAFDTTPNCAGTGTIGGGGSVTIASPCVVGATSVVLVTYTSAGATPAYVTNLVANTSFDVTGTAGATFNFLVVNRY